MARFKELYESEIRNELTKTLGIKNPNELPKLEKIVLNMGIGQAATNKKLLEDAVSDLTLISGQKPVITRAKKSIAGFKLREGMPVGVKVTLRGERMYEFLERLTVIALPRVRDFEGISAKSFDGRGNYALGIKEQLIFPEVDFDKVDNIRGMDIVIATSAKDDNAALELLKGFGMPFRLKKGA
jgi:large subunit ribosomal protein L5